MIDVRRATLLAAAVAGLVGCAGSSRLPAAAPAGPAAPVVVNIQRASVAVPAPDDAPADALADPLPPRGPATPDVLGCERPAAGWSPSTTIRIAVDVDPATNEGEFRRPVEIDVPQGPVLARPLLVVLHSHAADIRAARGYGWSNLPVADPPVVVYAQGLPEGRGGPLAWASAGRTDFGIDDVAYLRAAVAAARAATCVDGRRIFAAGFSNGGSMAGLLACQAADLFAGVLSVAGNYYPVAGGCQPGRGVGIVEMHALDDPVVAYGGGPGRAPRTTSLPRVADWVAGWTARDGCQPQLGQSSPAPGAVRQQWVGCRDGAAVTHIRYDRFGHRWPDAGAVTNDLWLWRELTSAARS